MTIKISRRMFLGGVLVSAVAPAIITKAMPVKSVVQVLHIFEPHDIHYGLNYEGTTTGRITSSQPAFQGIPRNGMTRKEREAFKRITFGERYGMTSLSLQDHVSVVNAAHDIFRF
jgi:DNA polymerase I-like protein with 3'-5' exonuclease and polymerase domains